MKGVGITTRPDDWGIIPASKWKMALHNTGSLQVVDTFSYIGNTRTRAVHIDEGFTWIAKDSVPTMAVYAVQKFILDRKLSLQMPRFIKLQICM